MVARAGESRMTQHLSKSKLPTGTRRVLVISPDTLPLPGLSTSGAGLRAWGLAQGLRSWGHEVTMAMPRSTAEAAGYRETGAAKVFEDTDLDAFVGRQAADVLVFQHWPWVNQLSKPHPHLIIDLHGPLVLETLYHSGVTSQRLCGDKLRALSQAQFFTCAGERQRNYFLGWLHLSGFDLREVPIEVVPFSHSPTLSDRSYPAETTFVYGGMFLPWQNPARGLHALVDALEASCAGRLWMFGGKHPRLGLAAPEFDQVLARLQGSSRATVLPLVSHDELLARYAQASVAWDVMGYNCERGMAITSRTVEYLWAGLPVVYQRFAELADLIGSYEAGWLVDPEDEASLRHVVREILASPDEVCRRGQNAQRLVRERLNWHTASGPLDRWVRQPKQALRFPGGPVLVDPRSHATSARVWQGLKQVVRKNRWTEHLARRGWHAGRAAWRMATRDASRRAA